MKTARLPPNWRTFKPEGDCLVIRYGAIGDMLQASSVFAALAEEGHRITLNTYASGLRVVNRDPHVHEAILQEKDQVPPAELSEYWLHLGRGFDRVANLSGSVEQALLASPGDMAWNWPHRFRDLLCSVDYLEAQHAKADVTWALCRPKFYASKAEKEWAAKYRRKFKGPVVVWALSGSSIHKSYPYTDNVVAALMLHTDASVVFVGDTLCQLLESGWANEPRVSCHSGRWGIRKALAFSQTASLVVGPETGILSAVSHETLPKLLLLSHSSPKNFVTWQNTSFMQPAECDCFPCHKLHNAWATCNRDEETGGAKCAANIAPDRLYEAIRSRL